MQKVVNRTFRSETVHLDGNEFVNCFRELHIQLRWGSYTLLNATVAFPCQLKLTGAAQRTAGLLVMPSMVPPPMQVRTNFAVKETRAIQ